MTKIKIYEKINGFKLNSPILFIGEMVGNFINNGKEPMYFQVGNARYYGMHYWFE